MIRASLVLLVLLTACGESYDQIVTEPEVRQCPPMLPARLDFGEVEPRIPGQQTVNLVNPNQRTALVVSVTRATPPFFLDATTVRLLPAQTVPLRITFIAPDARQQFGSFTYHRGEGCESQEIELTGVGTGALLVEESVIDFGPLPLDVKATRVLHLHNTRRTDVVVDFRATSQIEIARRVNVPSRSSLDVPVSVTPRAGQPLGGSIQAVSDAAGAGGVDAFVLQVIGRAGRPIISVDRTEFVVDRIPLDGWLMRRVWVTNSGDGPASLNLTVVSSDAGTPSVLSGASIANLGSLFPDSGVAAFLHLRADREGLGTGFAVLTSDDPMNPSIALSVTGTGAAIGACGSSAVTVTPPSVDWQPPMFPAQQTFTFTNSNGEDCLLDAIEAVHASNGTWRLAAGELDQALVPAGGSVTRTAEFSGPGDGFLKWNTYVPPFIQNGSVAITVRP